MEIGKTKKVITIAPLELPLPRRTPAGQPRPQPVAPDRVRVKVPA